MHNYTQLTARELRLKWIEIIGRPIPPIGRSLIIKYLLWYGQAKRERISPLGFFHEVAQAAKSIDKRPRPHWKWAPKWSGPIKGPNTKLRLSHRGICMGTKPTKIYPV